MNFLPVRSNQIQLNLIIRRNNAGELRRTNQARVAGGINGGNLRSGQCAVERLDFIQTAQQEVGLTARKQVRQYTCAATGSCWH